MEGVLDHKEKIPRIRMATAEITSGPLIPIEITAFEQLFKLNYKKLYVYALTIVRNEMVAEEIVQNVFYKIWAKKGQVEIQTSLSAYLYRSVYNDSLNHLKHEKVKAAYQVHVSNQGDKYTHNAASKVQLSELQQKLDIALRELPEQCRTIFQMSRFEELRYSEIASQLGLSVKTVENQMGKALRTLRLKLAEYLPILIALFMESINSTQH